MNWMKLFNKRRPSEVYNVRLSVTWTDRILEFAALLTNLAMWVVAAVLYRQAEGQEVTTHFNMAGEADATDGPMTLLVLTAVWTVVMLLMGFSAYRTRLINPPTKITSVKQLKLMVTQVRVINIVLGFMGICILLAMVNDQVAWIMIPALLLFIVVVVYSILIRKAG